ncbi:VapC toxin family PIN domain ribonuclease [Rhizobium rhizosphaerae]|uniref:Ribonuclease VapC n=1 Tax=Xaviernesmea rhizosphaerae TaxID=1672749 RepID=A0ABX3PDS4_9HYPH|nr:type II toxin-antitoxin system VapC family toxin [Xaviernesmea rhizosphaerae]OQP86239.1 VapC toxin family PIN domain ribonuclease [Xaviernesmea rhizosphaerae]
MIAVDTSALIAILQDEPQAMQCRGALVADNRLLMSAGTYAEAMIVAARRGLSVEMDDLIKASISDILPVTPERARRAAEAYRRWGKGFHPAGLNYGDCFAYGLAEEFACPLLFVGEDFARTDLVSARTRV